MATPEDGLRHSEAIEREVDPVLRGELVTETLAEAEGLVERLDDGG